MAEAMRDGQLVNDRPVRLIPDWFRLLAFTLEIIKDREVWPLGAFTQGATSARMDAVFVQTDD